MPEPLGDAAAARSSALFAEHGRMVYGLCRLLLRDPVEAEDAAQQTFLAAHSALRRGGGPRDGGPWLAAIARNECRARLRARSREPLALVREPPSRAVEGADTVVERRLLLAELGRAIGELPARQREAIVLRDLYGLRAREVGDALGLSRPAVEALVFRARRQLRVRLRPVAGALVVPLALSEGLAEALPGFSVGSAGAAGAGAVGAGLLAKLAGGAPLAAKVAAGTVAVGAGSVAVIETEVGGPSPRPSSAAAVLGPVPALAARAAAGPDRASGKPGPGDAGLGDRVERSGASGPEGRGRGDDDSDDAGVGSERSGARARRPI